MKCSKIRNRRSKACRRYTESKTVEPSVLAVNEQFSDAHTVFLGLRSNSRSTSGSGGFQPPHASFPTLMAAGSHHYSVKSGFGDGIYSGTPNASARHASWNDSSGPFSRRCLNIASARFGDSTFSCWRVVSSACRSIFSTI